LRREPSALNILADFVSGRRKDQDPRFAHPPLPREWLRLEPLPVHRLDQYTSGLFCLAMNPTARAHLIEQVRNHTMTREYIAFVEGKPLTSVGTWRNWLRLSADQTRQCIVKGPRSESEAAAVQEALTHFEIMAQYALRGGLFVSKLRLRL